MAVVSAHDTERTAVSLTFARDGSFVLDVSNDPNWLKLRMERFGDDFIDRVVLWVDGREVRPVSAEYLPPFDVPLALSQSKGERLAQGRPLTTADLATWRLRGHMPSDARSLRWYYGLVGDPYPLTIHRADGRTIEETIQGDAWSRPIDLTAQFSPPWRAAAERQLPIVGLVALLVLAIGVRVASRR